MTSVSVIVATCNRPSELEACLRSLEGQTLPPSRVIVVDDDPGGDETSSLVARFGERGPVRYVEGRRRGLADAHNRGLEEVDSELVAFTDDDVVVRADWLEWLAGGFSVADGVACVTGRILPYDLESRAQHLLEAFAGYEKGSARQLFDLDANRPRDPLFPFTAGQLGSGANMAFRRSFLDEIGGFDPALGAGTRARGGDDLSAFFEVIARGHRLVYEPAAVIHHRHAREYSALRGQVYGYGVGLTAFLAKCVSDRPSLLFRIAGRLPAGLAHALGPRSPRRRRLPYDYPRELMRLEWLGMLVGPFAYAASRREAAR